LNAGKNPEWEESIDIDVESIAAPILIEVYDVDVFSNEIIGAGVISGKSVCKPNGANLWIPIIHKGKQAGTVHIESRYTALA